MKNYNNAIGDIFRTGEERHEEEMAKMDALNKIASKSSSTNSLIYIIPVIGLVITGVIIAIVLKKKKG